MSRKKKALIVFLAIFCGFMAIFIWSITTHLQDLEVSVGEAMKLSFAYSFLYAGIAVCAYCLCVAFYNVYSSGKGKTIIDKESLPYKTKDGIYVYPKIRFNSKAGKAIFSNIICDAYLYPNRLIFRYNYEGDGKKALDLDIDNIQKIELYEIKKHVKEWQKIPGAWIKGLFSMFYSSEKEVEVEKVFWGLDIYYTTQGKQFLFGIEDVEVSGNVYDLCESLRRYYGITARKIQKEGYEEYIKL